MEKTLFINVWMWKDDGEDMINEHKPVETLEDSITQYHEEQMDGKEYLHTLHIHYNTKDPVHSFAREMDIEDFIKKEAV